MVAVAVPGMLRASSKTAREEASGIRPEGVGNGAAGKTQRDGELEKSKV